MNFRQFYIPILMLFFALLAPSYASNNFSSTGVSLLYGTNYKIPMLPGDDANKRVVVTLDTITQHSFGDAFGFVDITRSVQNSPATSIYGEFIPRFNLPQTIQPKTGLIEKFLLAPSVEYGASAGGIIQTNYLYGIGTNLKLPLFKVFQLNFFKRENQLWANNWQITPVWFAPFSIGENDYLFSGWLDFTTATRGVPTSVHTQSQYMIDIGKYIFKKKKVLYAGTEFKLWINKFLIKGVNEKVLQAMIMVRL